MAYLLTSLRSLKTFARRIRALILVFYGLLLVIHFVVKDHFQVLGAVFYALPIPILICLGLGVAILFYGNKTYILSILGVVLGMTIFWLSTYYFFPKPVEIPKNSTVVLFWNAANRSKLPVDILLERIKNTSPDIIGLVEAENATAADIQKLSKAFPSYEFQILEGNMLVGVKGSIEKITFICKNNSHDINFVDAQLTTGHASVAITDTFQDPSMDKEKTLTTVLQLALQNNSDVIIGDFNTPYESVHFRNFETEYKSFHDYGQGFSATWPYRIPLLELDQIFVSTTWSPILLKKLHHPVSDHAMLVGYFQKQP